MISFLPAISQQSKEPPPHCCFVTEPFCCILFDRVPISWLCCPKRRHPLWHSGQAAPLSPRPPKHISQCAARLPLPGSAFGCGPGGVSHWAPCLLASIVASQLAFQTISPLLQRTAPFQHHATAPVHPPTSRSTSQSSPCETLPNLAKKRCATDRFSLYHFAHSLNPIFSHLL
jgi:hypothetical protein